LITRIRAENFKSWKDTGELPLAPLTGLFGTNSSGKSSILQMLLMLKQTAESSDRNRVLYTGDERSLVNLGTFSDLIHNHDLNESLRLYISWRKDVNELSFQTIISEYQGRNLVEQFSYEFPTGMQFAKFNKFEQKSILGMKRKSKNEDIYDLISDNLDAKLIRERSDSQFVPIKCYGFPYSLISNQDDFHPTDFSYYFENRFSAIYYLGPLRDYPERTPHTWSGLHPYDIGPKGKDAIDALLTAQVTGQRSFTGKKESRSNKRINEIILEWFQYMKLLESFDIKPIDKDRKYYEIKVKKSKSSPEVLMPDVGFGVSQILPVLVLCYYVPDGAIILLEQPEIHLHPSVQADLADVLIDAVMNRNIQIILESHSEHLLRRLQRRIAEEVIPSDKVNLYFCRMENGASQIEKLQLDDEGYISNWPPNFFGDEMADLVAMTEAAIKRRENE